MVPGATSRVLVFRPGAIGDSLLCFPALAALRARLGACQLTLFAHPAVGPLVLAAGLADRFFARDAPEADLLFTSSPNLRLAQLGSFDLAVAWTNAPPDSLIRNLHALAPTTLVAPSRPEVGLRSHVAQHLVNALAPLGVAADALSWPGLRSLLGPPSNRDLAILAAQAPVVLHIGSGSVRKNWPAQRFARLAERLHSDLGRPTVVVAGSADDDALAAFRQAVCCPFTALLEPPLLDLARLLARSSLFVGNDSGPAHLAGLSGTLTLALFGPTDPSLWRPLGRQTRTLVRQPLESLTVDEVLAAALALVAQPP